MYRHTLFGLALIGLALLRAGSVGAEEPAPLTEEDLEFLEFLAEFDTGEEDWTDPLELEGWLPGGRTAKPPVRYEGDDDVDN